MSEKFSTISLNVHNFQGIYLSHPITTFASVKILLRKCWNYLESAWNGLESVWKWNVAYSGNKGNMGYKSGERGYSDISPFFKKQTP